MEIITEMIISVTIAVKWCTISQKKWQYALDFF